MSPVWKDEDTNNPRVPLVWLLRHSTFSYTASLECRTEIQMTQCMELNKRPNKWSWERPGLFQPGENYQLLLLCPSLSWMSVGVVTAWVHAAPMGQAREAMCSQRVSKSPESKQRSKHMEQSLQVNPMPSPPWNDLWNLMKWLPIGTFKGCSWRRRLQPTLVLSNTFTRHPAMSGQAWWEVQREVGDLAAWLRENREEWKPCPTLQVGF